LKIYIFFLSKWDSVPLTISEAAQKMLELPQTVHSKLASRKLNKLSIDFLISSIPIEVDFFRDRKRWRWSESSIKKELKVKMPKLMINCLTTSLRMQILTAMGEFQNSSS